MTPAEADELMGLAGRCEAATGADRELADEVLLACGWRLNHDADDIAAWRVDPGTVEGEDGEDYPVTLEDRMRWACWYKPGNRPFRDAWIDGHYRPDPLTSLDAAVTLAPAGFMWRLQSWPDGVNSAILEKNAGDFGAIDARHTETFAATPALALCAAALRARARTQETTDVE